ncbi:MAG: ABC transporter ATP-binding protein [Verrucomicrobiae bacterium]|nr:ABC transporter ATP-binding protein [Verrucomicrobiae bacterium]
MSEVAIRVENLGKQYRLGPRERYKALRDVLANPFRRSPPAETFWALRDVSFEVQRGEVVGVIGRNGAGKSTLLKILSQITEPTTGSAEIHGRVGSLLEVGTGFHPELTGRENIFLNGAILGMRKKEIESKFDEIVAFAEVEKFIDTPVKHYSSGMRMRLAFAVAAHLEPEILLVDEVLAVGDASFQKKCLGKMGDVAKQGRTVLFVSHNMGAIEVLCHRAFLLEEGKLFAEGPPKPVIQQYLASLPCITDAPKKLQSVDREVEIEAVILRSADGQPANVFSPGESITIELLYHAKRPVARPALWVVISSRWGAICGADMLLDDCRPERLDGRGLIRCTFHNLRLMPHQTFVIRLGGYAADGHTLLFPSTEIAHFQVEGSARDAGYSGAMADSLLERFAPVIVPYQWEFETARSNKQITLPRK